MPEMKTMEKTLFSIKLRKEKNKSKAKVNADKNIRNKIKKEVVKAANNTSRGPPRRVGSSQSGQDEKGRDATVVFEVIIN